MKRLNTGLLLGLGLGLGLVACDMQDVDDQESTIEKVVPAKDSALQVTLRVDSDFTVGREEATAVRVIDGYKFEIGMRVEDYETLVADGQETIALDLEAPEFSEVSHGGEMQRVEGSPLVATLFGDETVCGNALVRAYYLDNDAAGMIVDISHADASIDDGDFTLSTEDEPQQAAAAGDIIYSTFNKCDRFVGYDGKCGGVCGKYRLHVQEIWGEYSYGQCVPNGEYWLSSCKCTGPYGAWEH